MNISLSSLIILSFTFSIIVINDDWVKSYGTINESGKDTIPPEVKITKAYDTNDISLEGGDVVKQRFPASESDHITIEFIATDNVQVSKYVCKIGNERDDLLEGTSTTKTIKNCKSPFTYNIAEFKHWDTVKRMVFKVIAFDPTNNQGKASVEWNYVGPPWHYP